VQVLGDSAYGSGAPGATLAEAGHDTLIKPIPLRHRSQAGSPPTTFDIDHLAADSHLPERLDPHDHTQRHRDVRRGLPRLSVAAAVHHLPHGRTIKLHEHESCSAPPAATPRPTPFQQPYRQHRPMVERSIAWLVRGGNRKVRYRYLASPYNDLCSTPPRRLNLRDCINLGLVQQLGAPG
jgi:hypothetical protein